MLRYSTALIAIIAVTAFVVAPVVAQSIGVSVNGEPVMFRGTRPMTVQGRVLVPLRGVLEQMGAFVSWVPETRTVIAQKGDTDVQLPVGSRTAIINGRTVNLDVPASVVGGSTMVPLRFLGEALGADVRWEAAARTVLIETAGTPGQPGGQPPAQPQALTIASFTHNARGWLKAGSALSLVLEGTAGGTAFFEIPGVVNQQPMREARPGHYEATWTVPSGARITVSGASVIGLLRRGTQERLIQAGNTVSIDTVPPTITTPLPKPDSAVAQTQPSISAVLGDGTGSSVDRSSVRITVNGKDVTPQSTVTGSFVSYRPPSALAPGKVNVAVSLNDQAGNPKSLAWAFGVRSSVDVIKSFTHTPLAQLQPGDDISVKMEAEPGGTAGFSIIRGAETLRTVKMQESPAGVYTGEYTIRRSDNLTGAVIAGSFTTKAGQTFTTQSAGEVVGSPGVLAPPKITAPAEGAAAPSPLTISGTAPANTQVRVKLDYATTVLGTLRLTGTVAEQMVAVGKDGKFKSEAINLGTLVRGKDTTYTLTATTVGPDEAESEATVVTFGK